MLKGNTRTSFSPPVSQVFHRTSNQPSSWTSYKLWVISTGSESSRIPSLPNTPSQTNKAKSVYLARGWISVPCSSCKKCWAAFVAQPQLWELPAEVFNDFVTDHSPRGFPWPPLSLRISWNFWTGVSPAPGHLVPYSEAFLDVPEAFWALLNSTTTPGDEQNHIPSISPLVFMLRAELTPVFSF